MYARVVLICVVFASACVGLPEDPGLCTAADARDVAEAHVAERFPGSSAIVLDLTPIIVAAAGDWRVSYSLPEGRTGGVPTVVVARKDCSVVRSWASQ
jgi:hypothetical protein